MFCLGVCGGSRDSVKLDSRDSVKLDSRDSVKLDSSSLVLTTCFFHFFIHIRMQQQRADSPEPSCVSMKSDRSMNYPITFKDGQPADGR